MLDDLITESPFLGQKTSNLHLFGQKSPRGAGHFPFPNYKIYYPGAVWYSLPGPCPSENYTRWTDWCKEREPGGYCNQTPTGAGNCTWTYEDAGEITIDSWTKMADTTRDHSRMHLYLETFWLGIKMAWEKSD